MIAFGAGLHDDIAALGAVLTGIGSVTAAIVAAAIAHRRARDECDKRVADIKEAYEKGFSVGKMMREER
jgi:uncharacterized membrane protein (DUF485 family)